MPIEPLQRGLWGVLATPFHGDDLAIDEEALRRQVHLHQAAGSIGLVALGVFGESARLSREERHRVVEIVSREAPDLPLVIGIAERETREVIDAARDLLAASETASNSLMLQVPTSDPQALTDHLQAVHDATGAGVVVQDYPVVSGVTIAPSELLSAIIGCAFVVAVKSEAPPTSAAIAELTAGTDVPVFGGLGGIGLLDELMAGAAGAMTGFSYPEGLAATVNAWFDHGYAAARQAFLPWLPLINFEAQPRIGLAIRKASLNHRGIFSSPAPRPPAAAMPARLAPLLREHLEALPS
ncbi:dihydrodipicolinate synthase family protein [Nocardia jiangxiensis]|uniref:Dihydrodipicolinate synthase family protein n=1 Tax=Nocardia jiangxiensis TaxID=282685 RepID=A0ABW6SFZ0_9NOCA|nr:dihydrodipicolinate synthase family protein [Nocardia jiangxiensis]